MYINSKLLIEIKIVHLRKRTFSQESEIKEKISSIIAKYLSPEPVFTYASALIFHEFHRSINRANRYFHTVGISNRARKLHAARC